MALAYAFISLPMVTLVLFSFQDGRLPVPPFNGPTLKWYADVLGDSRLMSALLNSLLVGAGSAALSCAVGFLAAYGVALHVLPGTLFLRGLLIAPMTASHLIIGLGLFIVFNNCGPGPSLSAAGVGHVAINLPQAFAIIYASMGAQQENAERAARDLGASEARVLALVTVPMLAPRSLPRFSCALRSAGASSSWPS